MHLINLRTLNMNNPLGIDVNPYFSWIIQSEEQDVMQSAYKIIVKSDENQEVWNTGKIESADSNFIKYAGSLLLSCRQYKWEVTVWDNKGNECISNASFETAFLNPSEWQAKWAESKLPRGKCKPGFGNQPPATMFRKDFNLRGNISSARLYATCHGVYQMTINGKLVDNREFAPEFTVYEKYLCYQTYDIHHLLSTGDNAIGMYVGDGWYAGSQTQPSKRKNAKHAVLFQLHVIYDDGREEIVCSDNNVKTMYGPVLFSDLFSGEKYDANNEIPGWDNAGFNDAAWQSTVVKPYGYENLKAQYGEPVRPVMEVPAVELYTSPKGEKIIDFGQVLTGKVRFKINIPKKAQIILDHFETPDKDGNYFNNVLSEGEIGIGLGCDQRVVYVSNGKASIYEPYFTFLGFRYIRVAGLDEINIEDFTAIVLSSDKTNLGTFECSNPLINKLYANIRWSQRSNTLSIPTDCPQREKAGWTGDISIYATTALLNEGATPFLTRWMQNLVCEQRKNGAVPIVIPYVKTYERISRMLALMRRDFNMVASAGWGDAAVIVPYSMYQVTGNSVILQEQYESMKNWCNYVINKAKTKKGSMKLPKEIDQYLWNTGSHFGEWLVPSLTKDGYSMANIKKGIESTLVYIAPIFGWYSVSTMAEIASLLGNDDDKNYYHDIANKMKDAIAKGLIDENGNMPTELMGAYLLPIYFDLVPEIHKKHFADKLVKMIADNNGCLDTGFLGTPFLLDALCKIGRLDVAYEILYQEKCPSWLYEVKQGATSIWESWYAFKEDGNPMVMSLNHYAFGCVADWMFRYINGIDKSKAGFKHIIINPQPDDSLSFARRSFFSEYGEIICNWERRGGKFIVEVKIPCNTTATIILPTGEELTTGSGTYKYEC